MNWATKTVAKVVGVTTSEGSEGFLVTCYDVVTHWVNLCRKLFDTLFAVGLVKRQNLLIFTNLLLQTLCLHRQPASLILQHM